jgi:hypothetical protein
MFCLKFALIFRKQLSRIYQRKEGQYSFYVDPLFRAKFLHSQVVFHLTASRPTGPHPANDIKETAERKFNARGGLPLLRRCYPAYHFQMRSLMLDASSQHALHGFNHEMEGD